MGKPRKFSLVLFYVGFGWILVGPSLPPMVRATDGFNHLSSGREALSPQPIQPLLSQSERSQSPKLDPIQLERSLDQGNISGAVEQIELGWKRQFEDYYQGTLTSHLVSVDKISRILAKNYRKSGQNTALIYVVPTAKHLELILIAPNGPPIHRRVTATNKQSITELARVFRKAVADPGTSSTAYLPTGQTLYQWMLAPLEAELGARQINSLIFCLGGGLRSLPLAALHTGQQFLVEKYNLAIIPAFNLLDPRPSKLENTQILAMGASEFKNQGSLPGVPQELSAIVAQSGKGERWLNQNFTIANLKARRTLYPFEIIHLATHAAFLPGDVHQSYIQFWDTQLTPDQLQVLELRKPAVQLLVLSACQTALGDAQAELGFAGLAIQSGSRAALASLWSVSDVGTLQLMTEFYRQLQTASTKSIALRQTQIAMLKGSLNPVKSLPEQPHTLPSTPATTHEPNYAHPYYWSAFTLVGNPW